MIIFSLVTLLATLLGGGLLYGVAYHALHAWIIGKTTVMNELKDLGRDRADGRKLSGTAVICGGR